MKVEKNALKEALVLIKRVASDKKKGRMYVESRGDGILTLYAVGTVENMKSRHSIKVDTTDEFGYWTNPHEWSKVVNDKGYKEKTMVFEHAEKQTVVQGTKYTFAIERKREDWFFDADGWSTFQNERFFLTMLKGAHGVLKEAKDETAYLKMTSGKVLCAEENQIHLYRLEETFPYAGAHIHKSVIAVLSSSLKKELRHAMIGKQWAIQDQKGTYLFDIEKNAMFPDFRAMKAIEEEASFTVDADQINAALKTYTKDVPQVLLSLSGNLLTLDPRTDGFKVHEFTADDSKKAIRKAVFKTSAIKNLFVCFTGSVTVSQIRFKNVYGQEGYYWKIYTIEQTVMTTGIDEPDWERLEALHQKGEMKEIG